MMTDAREHKAVRAAVDFGYVDPRHNAIDARLVNWGRWSLNRGGSGTSPMFRMYRSPEHWTEALSRALPIDPMDAQRIQKAVSELPSPHRMALSWSYIRRNNPRKAAQALGESLEGLARLIHDGRKMLVNRGA